MLYDVSVASRRITIVYTAQRRLYDNLSTSAIIKMSVGGKRRRHAAKRQNSELLQLFGYDSVALFMTYSS